MRVLLRASVGAVVALFPGCKSTTGPSDPPVHPAGTQVARVSVADRPYGIAVSRSGIVYVSRLDARAVTRLSINSPAVEGEIKVADVPTDVEFSLDGATAYVTNQGSGDISVVHVGLGTETSFVPVSGTPFRVAVDPKTGQLWVSSNCDSVFRVDPVSRAITARIAVGLDPNGFAFSPDGSKLFVSNQTDGTVSEINLATGTVVRSHAVGGKPQEIIVSPDGTELYVANLFLGFQVWNLASSALVVTVPLSSGGFGMAMSPDQKQLWVTATLTGDVVVINRAGRNIEQTISVGGLPRRVAFSRKGDVAVISNEEGSVIFVR